MSARKSKKKGEEREKEETKDEKFQREMKEFYDKMKLTDLMLLKSHGPRAPLSSVIEDERNKKVIFKLVFTSVVMFTVPIAAYFVVYLGAPRLYPHLDISLIQTIGGFVALFFVLLISLLYLISAFLE